MYILAAHNADEKTIFGSFVKHVWVFSTVPNLEQNIDPVASVGTLQFITSANRTVEPIPASLVLCLLMALHKVTIIKHHLIQWNRSA